MASFYIPFDWLQETWNEIHGAFHVNIKRIRTEDKDARRLSRYIVAQYCGGQNALVRFSQSKSDFPFSRARRALRREMRELPERYQFLSALISSVPDEHFSRCANEFFRLHFRRAWDELARVRSCEAYGVQFAWRDGELRRI